MKKVSVILTTYNTGDTLRRTLDSIIAQKGIDEIFTLELLVIDDCSTDNTIEIIKEYNISYLSTPVNSGGPNKGRNIGLRDATGDCICFIDHDDEWTNDKIISQLPLLDKVPIVSSGYKIIEKESGKVYDRSIPVNRLLMYKRNETFIKKLSRNFNGQQAYFSTIMISKELKNIFFEECFGKLDFDWLLRLFEDKESAELSDSLMIRYVEKKNLSLNEEYRRQDYYYALYTIEKYSRLYPLEVSLAEKRINGSRAKYYYLMNNMSLARKYFRKSQINLTNIAYYLTTYFGSRYVKKHFKIFG